MWTMCGACGCLPGLTGSYTRAERTLVEAIRTAPSEQLYRRLSATYVAQDKLLDAQQMLDSITDPAIRASLEAARPQPQH